MGMDERSGRAGANVLRATRPGAPLFAGGAALEFEQAPPRMDVKFPILGFLMEAEATGYDLKNRFQDPVGFFYRVSDGSIYPALKKLAHDGLVTLRTERHGRRTRKVYAITARGREHFRRMLREPAQPLFVFDESQVKIYFADQEPEIALEHMERSRIDDETRTAILARMVAEMRRAGASPVRTIIVELGAGYHRSKGAGVGETMRATEARNAGEARREAALKNPRDRRRRFESWNQTQQTRRMRIVWMKNTPSISSM